MGWHDSVDCLSFLALLDVVNSGRISRLVDDGHSISQQILDHFRPLAFAVLLLVKVNIHLEHRVPLLSARAALHPLEMRQAMRIGHSHWHREAPAVVDLVVHVASSLLLVLFVIDGQLGHYIFILTVE